MRKLIPFLLLACAAVAQQSTAPENDVPKLKSRNDVAVPATADEEQPQAAEKHLLIVPAGTKIPVALRQAVSTKNAQPGDPIYGQTTFPVFVNEQIMIPGGTYVQGVVDYVKRAGRIKGTAELRFHLTKLIYPNGYVLDMAAAIDQVPGSDSAQMKEPGTVKHDSEKGKDLERMGRGATQGAVIGGVAGLAARPDAHGYGVGGLAGIAAGSMIGLLARGSDVRFEPGTVVDVVLNHAIALDQRKMLRRAAIPAYYPQPIMVPTERPQQ
jgi:type IV secretion system protein VirB10